MKNLKRSAITLSAITFFVAACDLGSGNKLETKLLGQNNAVWTESIYLRGYKPSTKEELTEKHLEAYAITLKKHNIKYAYLFAGPYEKDGHLPEYAFSKTAITSVRKLKDYYPEIVILPWIGGIQNRTVYLEDSTWVKNALADTKRLIETLGVPGIHIDLEYIIPGEPFLDAQVDEEKPGDRESYAGNVNNFHSKLRALLPNAFISSVVLATSTRTRPWKLKTTVEEISTLINYIDQLSFLYYDTRINQQATFQAGCLELLRDIMKFKDLESSGHVEYLIALGTFVNEPDLKKYRNQEIENIPNTLTTIKESLIELNTPSTIVDGIAIYCDWTTDTSEWAEIYEHWTKY